MRCTLSTQKPQTRRRPPYAPRSRPPSRRARAAGRWVAYPGAGAGAAPWAVVRDGGAPPGAVVWAAAPAGALVCAVTGTGSSTISSKGGVADPRPISFCTSVSAILISSQGDAGLHRLHHGGPTSSIRLALERDIIHVGVFAGRRGRPRCGRASHL